jgi:hypothetical protein
MTDEQDQYRELQSRLDEAAQWCRPRHPGWGTLLERLGPQESVERRLRPLTPGPSPETGEGSRQALTPGGDPKTGEGSSSRGRVGRLVRLAAGVLAAATLATVVAIVVRHGSSPEALAASQPVEVQRRGIEVTVFSAGENQEPTLYMPLVGWPGEVAAVAMRQALTQQQRYVPQAARRSLAGQSDGIAALGMGLVKDQRMVLHLKQGDNVVKFTDVAESIDPTSVRLTSETDPAGIEVIEQNFEFDLASADALLKRSIERRITCIGKDEQAAVEGVLLSYDVDTLVLADRVPDADPKAPRPKTQSIARRTLKAIRLDEVHKDLYTRPTLAWKLRAKRPGDHLTTLSYLCGNMAWQADYVVTIVRSDPAGGDTLDLNGWVTIDNRSGATYERAGLKLIAGDVNRVRDPWAPVPEPEQSFTFYLGFERGGAVQDAPVRREFIARELFEYKLYALNLPSTIKDQEIKQLGLLRATGVRARRRFVFDYEKDAQRLTTELVVKNEKANGLGKPLPKGRVTFVALDADGESQFLGRDSIDHTPKDEELTLKLGQAFDVTGQYRGIETRSSRPREMTETCEIRVRNHKDTEIRVRAVGHARVANANWEVIKTSDEYTKHDFRTIYFDFPLAANSEKVITYTTYTIQYRWWGADHEPRRVRPTQAQ